MKIREIITEYEDKFKQVSQSPRLDAELLLRRALKNVDRLYLLMNLDKEVSNDEFEEFKKMAKERLNHRPVAYILGEREFMGLDFEVREGVLIPRPDTEIIVERALKHIDELLYKKDIKLLDIGTGSGAIAISLKYYKPEVVVEAVDISDVALEVSKKNTNKILGKNKINIKKSNLFENINETYDIIVSNPPYIEKEDMSDMDAQVLNYEPHSALFAEDEGLYFYKRIIHEGKSFLNDGGKMIFECGHDQSDKIKDIFIREGYCNIKITKDLAGINRVIEAVFK